MEETVWVGSANCESKKVLAYAKDYLSGVGEWAYPAYDSYPGTPGPMVGEADLLAVCLLNAGQKPIPTYYGLKKLIPAMNDALAKLPSEETFSNANPDVLDAVADLFGILDEEPTSQVGKTKLMKVLHRKKPELIPLFDGNIRRCYSEIGEPPVPAVKNRTHRDFAVAWLPALQHDLKSQMEVWEEIVGMAIPGIPISPLRAIDIVGWRLGSKRR